MLELPPSTPVDRPYTNLVNSTQYAKNNFRPTKREWKRTMSPQESPSALLRNLKIFWGYESFRHPQLEICSDALRGCDLIVVAPTGLGKSLCFQLPAITIDHGVTIVVSPLKALMADQVEDLTQRGIKAVQLSEYTTWEQHNEVRKQMKMGHPEIRLLYVTPEMLLSDKHKSTFDIAYRQRQIARLVVDEAHVITEWGKSFRSKYRELGQFRQKYPGIPITALTASATLEVRNDIIQTLRIGKGHGQWVLPFNRRNLFYEVRYQGRGYYDDEDREPQKSTTDDMADFLLKYRPQAIKRNKAKGINRPCVTGIVYCRTTAACEEVADNLRQRGFTARPYYKNLSQNVKDQALAGWKDGSIECIVATIAFGMGIDQANVRYVIHYQMPKTFEGYYQETGRAGRDGHISHCLMYYSREDAKYLRGLVEQEDAKNKRNAKFKDGNIDTSKTPSQGLFSFKSLQNHIEKTGQCRHIGICSYFGEKIDHTNAEVKAAYCENMCDVCKNSAAVRKASMQLTEGVPVASPQRIDEIAVVTQSVVKSFNGYSSSIEDGRTVPENDLRDLHGTHPSIFDFNDEDEDDLEALGPSAPSRPHALQFRTQALSNSRRSAPLSGSDSTEKPLVPGSSNPLASSRSTNSSVHHNQSSHTPVLERDLSGEERHHQPIRIREIIHIASGGSPTPSPSASLPKRRKVGLSRQGSGLSNSLTSSVELENLEKKREVEMQKIRSRKEREREVALSRIQQRPEMMSPHVRYLEDSEEGTESRMKLTRDQRIKAEKMLGSVKPVRDAVGPYACYNAAAGPSVPRRRVSAPDKAFKPPILKSPNKVRSELLTKLARDKSVTDIGSALQDSLGHGELAGKLLTFCGKNERGTKRANMLIDIARSIERDLADACREDPGAYNNQVTEFRKAVKALRSEEVIEAIIDGEIDAFEDGGPGVGYLKALIRLVKGYTSDR
ncbi:hypothetical protein L202_00683 [Cryptococcus amylolentus CBS 6039]|uniref:ATP-dependent DNA helicase n=1 Tax=Cryptococcus amylolentus CBS 6039 TaxID=1295533 RepID=A0A1E3I8V5_9TREE|nr:hypothetical protein L202_00683 [Cryptococcus amylolentus CBS 6039]ODN84815.1 hypothetical protein L202_00683 [Cryptococcus amylolentus CBS 6039]